MSEKRILTALCVICLLPLLLGACSDSSDDTMDPAKAVMTSEKGILRYVPADTPYLFAALQPAPDGVLDKLAPHIESIARSYGEMLQSVVIPQPHDGDDAQLDAGTRRRVAAVLKELGGMISADGVPQAGIDRNSTAAIYGVGLLPVLRVTLSDEALFEATVLKLESRAGAKMDVASIDGHAYRYAGNAEARVIVAVIDGQLVVTGVPTGLSEPMLKSVLGLSLPEENIAATGTLAALADSYGFKAYGLGMIDVERVAATFVEDQTGVNAELLALIEYDAGGMSEVCRKEILSIAAIAPRVATGYTDITTEHFKTRSVVELRSDIAAGVRTLTASVPGLGMPQGGLMSFGMSLDMLAARTFYSSQLDALETDPYECESLAQVQAAVAQGRALLSQPVPPVVYAFHGFLAVIDDIKGMDLRKQQPPTEIDMRLLVATENPQALVATGAMFSQEIAAMNLQPDSKPVKLEVPALAAPVEAAWVAMSEQAIALSVGDGSESGLEGMLGAASREPSPFMSMNMDAGRYYGFIGDAMTIGDTDEPLEVARATGAVMKNLEQLFERISFDIEFTERGVEIPSTMELAD